MEDCRGVGNGYLDYCSHASGYDSHYPAAPGEESTCCVNCAMDYPVRDCDSMGAISFDWNNESQSPSPGPNPPIRVESSSLWFGSTQADDFTESQELQQPLRDMTFDVGVRLSGNDVNMSKVSSNNSLASSKQPYKSNMPKVMKENRFKETTKKKNNENNNFMKDRRGKFTEGLPYRPQSWRDENVHDRINVLATPKKNFLETKPPSTKWRETDYQPDPERLDVLAKPRGLQGEWCGRSPNDNRWECSYPFEPQSMYCRDGVIDPDMVDWDRLAHCKVPYQQEREVPTKVSKAALNAVATRRLEKLSVPRKIVDSDEYYLWLLNKKPDTDAKLLPIKRLSIHKIELNGERVLLRCDLDHTKLPPNLETKVNRIRVTTQYCLNRGAKAVIIASHCGKPKCRGDMKYSLKCASEMLAKALNKEVVFLDDCIGPEAQALCEDPEPGSVFVLENLRFYPEEEGFHINQYGKKKACTKEEIQAFRARLFQLGDVFIHDDFNSLVDMSNTTIGSQKQERAYGWNIFFELSKYNAFVTKPQQPMVAVIGGNFNDKIDVVYNIMGKAQEILLGGEIAQIFLKTLKGIDIGITTSTPTKEKKVLNAMSRAKDIKCIVNLPTDLVVRNQRCPDEYFTVCSKMDVEPWFEIVDIGETTRECYIKSLQKAKSIVWSGDMGILLDGTAEIGEAIHKATCENFTTSFIMDEETEASFKSLVPQGEVTAVTGDGQVTSMLLHRKMPKGLMALSPYRKSIKKRAISDEPVSFKPSVIDKVGYRMETGFTKLCIDDMNVENMKVMIVCDLTAPVLNGKVIDNYGLRMVVPTIRWILKRGAKLVIISSPIMIRDKYKDAVTLKPMAVEMEKLLFRKVQFVPESSGKLVQQAIENAHHGSVIMLENFLDDLEEHYTFMMEDIGSNGRRRGSETVSAYCEMLSRMCDIWVNDAFSLLARDSSHMTGCMHRVRPCGFLVKNELKYLSKTFNAPPRKFLAIIGGHHVHKQIDTMRGLLRDVDDMIITGMLGLHCLWVLQGMRLGLNFDRSIQKTDIQALLDLAAHNKVRLYFPVDIVTTNDLESAKDITYLSTSDGVGTGRYFADIGPKTISLFSRIIKRSKLVVWVGVVGLCTLEEYRKGTRAIYDTVCECTQSDEIGLTSIVGGEFLTKYVHAIDPNHEGVSHVTTGPGVMLKLLSEKRAVALDTISHNAQAVVKCISRMTIDQADIKDKRIIFRADFRNQHGPKQTNNNDDADTIRQLASTIKNFFKKGALCVLLMGHMGNPQGLRDDAVSLAGTKQSLEKHFKSEITFFENGITDLLEFTMKTPESGGIYMVENMRFNPPEIGYGMNHNDQRINSSYEDMDSYRHRLSKLGDIFINDSMEALHTTDSSLVGFSGLEHRVAGPNLKTELAAFSKLIPKIDKPLLAIVGGMEEVFEKTKLIYDLIDIADSIIICGKVALNFLKVMKYMFIGKDTVDKQAAKIIHRVVKKANVQNVKLQFPVDFNIIVPADPNEEDAEDELETFTVQQGIPENERAVDVGDASLDIFIEMITEHKTILYTGSVGVCNNEKSAQGALAVLEAMAIQTVEQGAVTIAFGTQTSSMCLGSTLLFEQASQLSHISRGRRTVVDLIMGRPLPGLDALSLPPVKPLQVLTLEQLKLKGKKVLLRLDLDVPTVEGMVLDTDKLEQSLETIKYILSKDPMCLILAGFRGNPRGYKNLFLSMKPVAMEFEHFLQTPVTFLDEPCSRKSRVMCEDTPHGTVFLMENLKFYPAEVGQEEEMVDLLMEDELGMSMMNTGPSGQRSTIRPGASASRNIGPSTPGQIENIDKLMYELMPYKSVDQYTREIGDCCDVYINDDVTHMYEHLTSNLGFDLNERACGFRMKELLQYADDSQDLKKSPAVTALSPAPKE